MQKILRAICRTLTTTNYVGILVEEILFTGIIIRCEVVL